MSWQSLAILIGKRLLEQILHVVGIETLFAHHYQHNAVGRLLLSITNARGQCEVERQRPQRRRFFERWKLEGARNHLNYLFNVEE